ncbi:hypothetical protein PCNPT3_06165 [Psychromonas sp. CNPT3]|uniref:ASCH domain-containing protein n=1 Tax=Psychromonas sp. CNPT3 TaxID=314282 RepID=UPI00006E9D05|nr:ASCH domain-containing protein [Psychromonas sp. CNPT3]AGH81175.1 hypothetical protein PCNPT3_06165 [Psychromonas sp. CNPT3]
MEEKAKNYLNQYLGSLSASERQRYQSFSADYFCADEYNANLCAELIRKGQKTATCSLKYGYGAANEPMPKIGHLMVVTDWNGHPICIVEIDSVKECKYSDVSTEFAYLEGEGDRTLKWWRKAHWDFFVNECSELNIDACADMMLVLEQFHVVHPSKI